MANSISNIPGYYDNKQSTITNINNYNNEVNDTDTRTPKTDLGKDEFLQILAMQLANQDPLEPMKDTDFIAQMAQFSSLEQMQALNAEFANFSASMNSAKAYNLIGKDVYAEVAGVDGSSETEYIYGRVQGVTRYDGTDYLQVGDYMVPLTAVHQVFDSGQSSDALLLQSSGMIGKSIEGEIPTVSEDGETTTEKVSGVVEEILVKNGVLYAKLADTDKEVPVSYITKIS